VLVNEQLRCCFCGRSVERSEYIEMEIRIEGTSASQFLGAHRRHLLEKLATGFSIEIEPEDAV